MVKIRDGQVANRPVYVVMGVNVDGERDVLGLWVGPAGGEGAKFWTTVRATWPLAEVQLCVVHLVRSSLRYTSKRHCPA